MNKFKKLLSLEKDINILEQFGNYKSAKVLHKKFMRVAQQSIEFLSEDEAIKSVDDSSATQEQKNEAIRLIRELFEYKRLGNISAITKTANTFTVNNQLTQNQKIALKSLADRIVNTYIPSTNSGSPTSSTTETPSSSPSASGTTPPSDSGSVSTEKSSGDQPSSGTLQNGSSDSHTSIWRNIFRIAYNENISLPDALNKFAGTGVKFNGKTLASHINYPKLKAKFPQNMPSKEINKNSRQYSFMILYALTDYVLDNQLFQYLNPPEGYEFPANMAGKPLNLNIYERIGLFRSTYPQERMFIFQKIKQLDPNSEFQGNGILPRIQ